MQYSNRSLGRKMKNKLALQMQGGLPEVEGVPMIGLVSRMDYQKGIDTAIEALHLIGDLNWQAFILGSGTTDIEQAAEQLMEAFPEKVFTKIGYLPDLAREIYAGADMFLIPSRYEPCGLTQMISMRYGTVPVASSVGGLKDTITDYGDGKGDGFLVEADDAQKLAERITDAINAFADQKAWRKIQLAGMRKDFSWDASANKYLTLYKELLN